MDASTARTANIRLWVAEEGGPAEFSRRFGMDPDGRIRWAPAQVSAWISDTNPKGIGHALARRIEGALNKAAGSMDREPASQALGLDRATLRAATKFLEDMFSARGKEFIASDRIDLLTAVYDDLRRATEPNVVALTIKYGRLLDGTDEREGQAGSVGADDRRGNRKGAGKAAAAARRAR